MSGIINNPDVAQHHFTSFEVFSSILRGYDLDIKQIGHGKFSSFIQQIQCGPVTINRFTITRRMEINGNPPPGVRTFGIPTASCQPFVWRGKKSSGDTIQIYSPSTELELITHPEFEAIDISISERDFNTLNHLWGIPDLEEITGSHEMKHCDPTIMQRLRKTLLFICESINSNPTQLQSSVHLQSLIKHEVPYLLAQALMSSETHTIKSTANKRSHALKIAIDYIQSTSNEIVSIQKLCHVTGINERTLQRAFLDKYNITPKSYIQAQRLNNAYKELLTSDPLKTNVADVASQLGYWHMSQFAADYRRQFGELPSETLKAS